MSWARAEPIPQLLGEEDPPPPHPERSLSVPLSWELVKQKLGVGATAPTPHTLPIPKEECCQGTRPSC